jgi:CHAT domain-containing protein/tetratricopeptide (TPR) repeat protein
MSLAPNSRVTWPSPPPLSAWGAPARGSMTLRATRRGILLAAAAAVLISGSGPDPPPSTASAQTSGRRAKGTDVADSAQRTARVEAALSSRQQAVIARIDSLWEAEAGLASRELVERHIADARAASDSLFLLNLLCREGRLLAAVNLTLEAEPVLREGMRLATALGDSLLYRASLRWLGVALIGQGRLDDVRKCFEELLLLTRQSGDRYHEGYAWMGLAYVDWQSGRAGAAREKYTRSVQIFRHLGEVRGELWALVGLNNAMTMLGDYEEAIAGHRRLVAIGKDHGFREIEALGHNNLGVLLFSLGDTGEALAHFQRAAELQEQVGNVRESIIAGQNVCICEVILGRTRDASRRLGRLVETSRANGYADVEVKTLNALAYAHLQQGDYRSAAMLFRRALNVPEGLTPKDECEAAAGLSATMAHTDSTNAALRLLRSKLSRMLALEDPRIQSAYRNEMAERLLDDHLPDAALKMAVGVEHLGSSLGLTELRLTALPIAAQAALALGFQDSALVLLRRGVRLWEAHRGLPLDPEWREQRGAAARRLFVQLTWLNLHYPATRPHGERIRDAFDALQTYKARTLLERMMGPGGRDVPVLRAAPVTLEELQGRVLQPGELLLDFVVGPEHTLLFACTPAESRAVVLPGEKELSRKAHLFHELLATRVPPPASPAAIASIDSTARNLADALFSACTDLIVHSRHVVVVPDGALNLLPMAYLLNAYKTIIADDDAHGRSPRSSDAGRTVSQVPAAALLAWLRREAGQSPDARCHPGSILALSSPYTDHGEMLPGTRKEISILARRYAPVTTRLKRASMGDTLPGNPAVGCGISPSAFGDFDILHFAAHSTVDDQSPWRSAIHLGADADRTDGYILQASEIAGWRLPARLVVLSSCESAGGRILSGEGVQGLTSAFLSARVPCVLATLWPVDDRVTVDFMTALYEGLYNGENVSTAVLKAQDIIRRRPRTAHPFYWAGFTVVGEGEMHVSLSRNLHAPLMWWTAALIAAIMLIGGIVKRRREKTSLGSVILC